MSLDFYGVSGDIGNEAYDIEQDSYRALCRAVLDVAIADALGTNKSGRTVNVRPRHERSARAFLTSGTEQMRKWRECVCTVAEVDDGLVSETIQKLIEEKENGGEV